MHQVQPFSLAFLLLFCSGATMAERTDLAFPDLSADDFDRYAHQFLGNINRGWDHPDFPFNILTLPRLPKIHNAILSSHTRTHRSLRAARPSQKSFHALEFKSDSILNIYATEAVLRHGMS